MQYGWDIAERFTHAALMAHGVTIDAEGFGYARGRKPKIDCNAGPKYSLQGGFCFFGASRRPSFVRSASADRRGAARRGDDVTRPNRVVRPRRLLASGRKMAPRLVRALPVVMQPAFRIHVVQVPLATITSLSSNSNFKLWINRSKCDPRIGDSGSHMAD